MSTLMERVASLESKFSDLKAEGKSLDVICPFMSSAGIYVPCEGKKCAQWIYVYTTENISYEGCSIALAPQMKDGRFRD